MLFGRLRRFNDHQGRSSELMRRVTSLTRVLGRWARPQSVGQWLSGRERRRLWRRLANALELKPQAGKVNRRPSLVNVSTRLEIEWYARDIHPWDCDLPRERQARLFAEEALTHTAAAIRRAFARFPEVDAIEIRVLEPHKPHGLLFTGAVTREDLKECSPNLSPAMTLKLLGIEYRLVDGNLTELREAGAASRL